MSHIELRVPVAETTHRRLVRWCQAQAEAQGIRRVSIRAAVVQALDHLLADPGKVGAASPSADSPTTTPEQP